MKKSCFILTILFFSLILINNIYSQDTTIPNNLNVNPDNLENINQKIENFSNNDINGDYINNELKKIILKNTFIRNFDKMMTKISIVFVIFIGLPYSFSLQFIIAFTLFMIILIKLPEIIANRFKLPDGIPLLLSVVILGLFGQARVFKGISAALSKMILSSDNLMYLIIFVGVTITIFVILFVIESYLAKYLKEQKEKQKKDEEDLNREILKRTTKKLLQSSQ